MQKCNERQAAPVAARSKVLACSSSIVGSRLRVPLRVRLFAPWVCLVLCR